MSWRFLSGVVRAQVPFNDMDVHGHVQGPVRVDVEMGPVALSMGVGAEESDTARISTYI